MTMICIRERLSVRDKCSTMLISGVIIDGFRKLLLDSLIFYTVENGRCLMYILTACFSDEFKRNFLYNEIVDCNYQLLTWR